jgi:hypothetical protein
VQLHKEVGIDSWQTKKIQVEEAELLLDLSIWFPVAYQPLCFTGMKFSAFVG